MKKCVIEIGIIMKKSKGVAISMDEKEKYLECTRKKGVTLLDVCGNDKIETWV